MGVFDRIFSCDVAAVDRGAARDGASINQPIQQLEPETLAATSD